MPDRRYSLLFYTAVLTAVGATYGVYKTLQNAQTKNATATRSVVIAKTDMPEGTSLTKDVLSVREFPVVAVPESSYRIPDSVVGRILRVPIFAGEAVVPGRLAPMGTGPGLEVKITPGRRAMAVKIDDVAGISGLIQPNSRVDVVVTLPETETHQSPVSKVFMENVRVLSVGTTVQRDVDGKPINATTAALEVTPEEAERLAVATNAGSVQLVLRGFGDPQTVATPGAYTKDVVGRLTTGAPPPPRPPVPPPAPRTPSPRSAAPVISPPPPPDAPVPARPESTLVTIYRGDKVEQTPFKKPEKKSQ